MFHQAVKRSNRVGSTRPLHVHLPVTDIERMQMENVLRKAEMVQRDTEEQEAIFKSAAIGQASVGQASTIGSRPDAAIQTDAWDDI